MSYTLAAAAAATGVSQSKILKAIKNGKIPGTKDERGEWHVEPAELHRVYPALAAANDDGAASTQFSEPDVEELGAQIEALLRQASLRLRQQIDERQGGGASGRFELADQQGKT
jgi:excisionase family DNA binding protein